MAEAGVKVVRHHDDNVHRGKGWPDGLYPPYAPEDMAELDRMIKEGHITLGEIRATVTYHDPCDLGRNSGIYEEPREVLKAIPGIRFVELANNRQLSVCCGGGGNVEMVNPELSAKVAQMKLEEIKKTGADMVVSSCQQCLRTIASRARRRKMPLVVKDLTDLVADAMG